jgi:hypothetical protein
MKIHQMKCQWGDSSWCASHMIPRTLAGLADCVIEVRRGEIV